MTGLFVTFEGGDGSGKSSQAGLLEAWLLEGGHEVVRTREPGGTEIGELLREIILHRPGYMDPRAEALLYAADRAQHIATLVRPALERGAVVIQDRYLDSSVAYQGAGRVLDPAEVRGISLWAAEGLLPDLTILLDIDAVTARSRRDATRDKYDRLEAEHDEFHERVRVAYHDLAAAEPDRFLTIDATLPIDEIAGVVRARVASVL